MNPITIVRFLAICIATLNAPLLPQLAQAQLPAIVDSPTTPTSPKTTSSNASEPAIAKLEVSCQDSKTIVKKGNRQATMVTWSSNYFGRDFKNEKRCQVVSERLQKAADLNGGSFQGLELASGTVNFQPVICALQNGSKKCDRDNLLFTLKPENAKNPDAVIQQMVQFGEDGSTTVEESARAQAKVDRNLGSWERKAFAKQKFTTNSSKNKKGF
jgi:Circadian oscillating protein COP23